MHYPSLFRKSLIIAVVCSPLQVMAAGQISYSAVNTVDAEPGEEINKGDFAAEYSLPVYASEDHRRSVSVGGAIQDTAITFDEAGVDDLDLIKIKFPVTGNNVLESGKIVSWSVVPGLHGEADELSDADFRIEGQAMMIIPTESRQWVVGLGYGESFGEPQIFPMFGTIWSNSPGTQWTLMFPMVQYEHASSEKSKYRITLAPDGAQWSWAANTLADNTDQADISVSGISLSGGFDWALSGSSTIAFDAGWVINREITVTNHEDADRNVTIDLDDALYFKLGWKFK